MSATERELKLTAAPSFAMPTLEGLPDEVEPVAWAPEQLSTIYFDTDDLRLARWGVSMRHRLGQGWTVKLPAGRDGATLVRHELTFAGSGRRPPAAAVDLLRAFVREAKLTPQARLETTRRRTELRDRDGRLVADVFEDVVSVKQSRGGTSRFHEIEVEIGDETTLHVLDALLVRLREAGADGSEPTSKYVRALGSRMLDPEVDVPELDADASAGDVVRRAIAASVTRLVVHDPVMRLDTDPEGVHQARVATRRLRSDLRTFRSVLDRDRGAELREELRWLAQILGAVRDGDVLLERIRRSAAELPEAHARGAADVLATLESERNAAHARLLATLRDPRYVRLLDRLVAEAAAPALLPVAEMPGRELAPGLVRDEWRSLSRAGRRLGKRPADGELHDLRIRAKRVRYAAEAVAPTAGKPAQGLAEAAAALQTVLGDLNDAVVAEQWLSDWTKGERSPEGVAAALELVEAERIAAARERGRWRSAWKRLSEPKLRAWL